VAWDARDLCYVWDEHVRRTRADAVPAGPERPGLRPCTSSLEGAVNLKKVITWLIVAFIVFYIVQAPESAAQVVKNAGQALGNAASSFADFVGSLV